MHTSILRSIKWYPYYMVKSTKYALTVFFSSFITFIYHLLLTLFLAFSLRSLSRSGVGFKTQMTTTTTKIHWHSTMSVIKSLNFKLSQMNPNYCAVHTVYGSLYVNMWDTKWICCYNASKFQSNQTIQSAIQTHQAQLNTTIYDHKSHIVQSQWTHNKHFTNEFWHFWINWLLSFCHSL